MKIKIGDNVYNSNNEPVMLIFDNETDRILHTENIKNMDVTALKYCIYTDDMNVDDIRKFMIIKK